MLKAPAVKGLISSSFEPNLLHEFSFDLIAVHILEEKNFKTRKASDIKSASSIVVEAFKSIYGCTYSFDGVSIGIDE